MKDSYKKIISTTLGTIVLLTIFEYNMRHLLEKSDQILLSDEDTSSFSDNDFLNNEDNISLIDNTGNNSCIDNIITNENIDNSGCIDDDSNIDFLEDVIDNDESCEDDVNSIGIVNRDTDVYCNDCDNSIKIGSLKISDRVIRLLSRNGYDLVKSDQFIGFVDQGSVEYLDEFNDEDKFELRSDIGVIYENVNLRDNPTLDGNIIRTLPVRSELEIYALVNQEWLLVRYNDEFGYIYAEYVKSLYDSLLEDYPDIGIDNIKFKKVVYVNTDELNIRQYNNIESDIVGSLSKYESVRVIDEDNEWYFIMTNDYKFGYIAKNYASELDGLNVVVDLSEQREYLYNNNILLYKMLVTTGKDSTPSDIGLFKIFLKERDCVIAPPNENTFVNYWMPYNNSIEGLHDASWRSIFGDENYHYNGSNGCINMQHDDAEKVYNTVSVGTKVLVHK